MGLEKPVVEGKNEQAKTKTEVAKQQEYQFMTEQEVERAKEICQELDTKAAINGVMPVGEASKNMAVAIAASKLINSGEYGKEQAIGQATYLYNKGLGDKARVQQAVAPLVVTCLAYAPCTLAVMAGLGLIWKATIDFANSQNKQDQQLYQLGLDIEEFGNHLYNDEGSKDKVKVKADLKKNIYQHMIKKKIHQDGVFEANSIS